MAQLDQRVTLVKLEKLEHQDPEELEVTKGLKDQKETLVKMA